MNNLEDNIDRPIRGCVAGMALLGFNPRMSCCGYTYSCEEVEKAHMTEKAYMFLTKPKSDYSKALLLDIALDSGWKMGYVAGDIIDFYGRPWEDGHPWKKDCPHRFEICVLNISALFRTILKHEDWMAKETTLTDGNLDYKEKYGDNWMQEVKRPWTVTKEYFMSWVKKN